MGTGKRIEQLRSGRGLLQKDLAGILNVSTATISHYESDIHQPDAQNLVRLADFFDISTDFLLGRIDFDLSLSVLHRVLSNEAEDKYRMTAGQLIGDFEHLSAESKKFLIQTLHLLKLKERVGMKIRKTAQLNEKAEA